ncbi:MAG: hypothetical protein US74_C0050G0005 [Parcubacteria group bacterium GW2011_GWA2_38_13]|nr:MAG: hypothetical protein US74_C0050G0005 [Parcubacteria group bacterium GW2011_GWA2_38_13]
MAKSHAAVWATDAPSPAQLKEFFAQIENGRVTKDRLQAFLTREHAIDCDALPYIPHGWEVRQEDQLLNTVKGQLEWDPTKIALYLSDSQKYGKLIKGTDLRKELEHMAVLNANVLDFLLAHPDLILEEWKGKYIFFWGTIYRDSDGGLIVRYLDWCGCRWDWGCGWLGGVWREAGPAVVLASST